MAKQRRNMTARHLQNDLMKSSWITQDKCFSNNYTKCTKWKKKNLCPDSKTHSILDHKEHQKFTRIQYVRRTLNKTRVLGDSFRGLMKPNRNHLDVWTSSISGVRMARLMTRAATDQKTHGSDRFADQSHGSDHFSDQQKKKKTTNKHKFGLFVY